MTEVLSEALGDIDLVNPDNYVERRAVRVVRPPARTSIR